MGVYPGFSPWTLNVITRVLMGGNLYTLERRVHGRSRGWSAGTAARGNGGRGGAGAASPSFQGVLQGFLSRFYPG